MSRNETRGFGGKKALNCQIFMVGYLQFVKTKHLNAAVFSRVTAQAAILD
jgi:hypothetical protein